MTRQLLAAVAGALLLGCTPPPPGLAPAAQQQMDAVEEIRSDVDAIRQSEQDRIDGITDSLGG
ncbi:hypothetical protein [Euzebya pacifica]|nr:hypothetical protein [Euzebya pacifica]